MFDTYCACASAYQFEITSSADLCVYVLAYMHTYTYVCEDTMMEAGEGADSEKSRTSLLFRSDFSGFEKLEPRDG